MSVNLKVSRQRRFSAHHLFVHVARTHLDRAVLHREASTLNILIAITFSAIGVEAISNSFGSVKIADWLTKHERKRPMKKVRLICDVLAVPYEDDKDPWHALEWLIALRDRLAHAKPDLIIEEGVLTSEQYDALQAGRGGSGRKYKPGFGSACARLCGQEAGGRDWSGGVQT